MMRKQDPMTDRFNPIARQATLGDQLKRKGRSRREGQQRMALASGAPRRNDRLPRLELTYVPIEEASTLRSETAEARSRSCA